MNELEQLQEQVSRMAQEKRELKAELEEWKSAYEKTTAAHVADVTRLEAKLKDANDLFASADKVARLHLGRVKELETIAEELWEALDEALKQCPTGWHPDIAVGVRDKYRERFGK